MAPITLYTAGTPNGFKASITLEELGIGYEARKIDLGAEEQKQEWFLKINPNGRIPALVDHDNGNFALFESAAMMIYLADRYGNGLLYPKEGKERYEVLAWVMFQMGGVGPMMGQFNHFTYYAPEKVPYAQKRYYNESKRLLGVLEQHLSDGREYLVGGTYSLADIANFSWVVCHPIVGIDLDEYPNLKAWKNRILAREPVRKGLDVPSDFFLKDTIDDEAKIKEKIKEALEKAEGVAS